MKLVLASGSAWRLDLLHAAGIVCTAVRPAIHEHEVTALDPVDLACARALAKARDVACRCGAGWWVIGADQVVHLGGEVFGKPADDAEHLAMLQRLRGRTHQLATGVAILAGGSGGEAAERCLCEITRLTMRADLTDDELRAYVACGEARACGGGYMIERRGIQLFEKIDGDWTNVVGLPIIRLVGELRGLGWRATFGSSAGDAGS